ncbi:MULTISPECIES: hypothetical protein [Brevibacterium]|uniref:Uncharacterized protein n=1 Tax=Brevibacterium casei TaxID=33889 RepID=A0A7T4DIN4_9MICO|nr:MULTISPECIES: hypothetical protein [Brevibacterium]QQB13581.1 hypothetical protein I6H47_12265 [Brevibacterium casei]
MTESRGRAFGWTLVSLRRVHPTTEQVEMPVRDALAGNGSEKSGQSESRRRTGGPQVMVAQAGESGDQ